MMSESRARVVDVTERQPSPSRQPSQTAMTAAAARAAHLLYDKPPYIFEDTMAAKLLGRRAKDLLQHYRLHGDHVILRGARAQVVARARFTEDVLAAAVARGVRQYVILGAGFDSYVYRVATPGLRVFEVDHAGTQEAKRKAAKRFTVLTEVAYVPVDFERQSLVAELATHGFDPQRPSVVSWLGVTMYLTREAVAATLAAIAAWAPGTQLVLDYMVPEGLRDREAHQYAEEVGMVAAQRGEPWLTFLTPDECTHLLQGAGFGEVHQVSPVDAVPDGLWRRDDALMPSGLAMLAHARVEGPAPASQG
jgi:methyltransferase (TIGR00027 family)